MKSTKRIAIIITTLIQVSLLINSVNSYSRSTSVEMFFKPENQIEKNPNSANYWDLTGSPIYIDDSDPNYNWSKTAADNDWCRGNGSQINPFIIENITIDGQGSGSCIEIRRSNKYFIIRNCTLYRSGSSSDEDGGINLMFVNNGKVFDNNCSYNNANGISLKWSNDNSISGNIVNNNDQYGLRTSLSASNIITLNNISHNNDGIFLANNDPPGNNISHNIVNNNYNNGIHLYVSRGNNILDNKIYSNNNSGIYDVDCHHNVISNNEIYNNDYSGIEIDNSESITTSMNEINSNEYGIHLEGGMDNVIFGNNATYNINTGIVLLDSVNNNIANNNVNNNEIGIYLENTNNTDISDNNIFNNTIGLFLNESNHNNIIGNNLTYNLCYELNCNGNYFKDNVGIPDTLDPPDRFPFETIVIALIAFLILIISFGILFFKRKFFPKIAQETRELQRTEAEVSVEKEKHFCVVHRGKIVGAVYICPECETYYCMKCATVLKKKGETCWACHNKIEL